MSSLFSKPRTPDIPPPPPEPEPITTIEEDAAEAAKRRKKRVIRGGRQSTILSGIQMALKKRLGE